MAIKHKTFRRENGNITPYMLWILCGFVLGHRLYQNSKHKRMCNLVLRPSNEVLSVHREAVDALIKKNLVAKSSCGRYYSITGHGFMRAHDRLKSTDGIRFKNFSKDETVDSSNFVG